MMRVLLDEDVPLPALSVLQHVLRDHDVHHLYDLGWSGKKDPFVYRDARRQRYDIVVTNDRRQMTDPDECDAVRKSRVHRVSYEQKPGVKGLALTIASLVAAMPGIMDELEAVQGQRLVTIIGINPRVRRYDVVDPQRDPPPYWR